MPASETAAPASVPAAGIFVPVPTFFQASSSPAAAVAPALDTAEQVRHAVFLARAGITGLVLLGSTGEAVHLTRAERVAMITAVRAGLARSGFADYPLMAGTATHGVADTLELLAESAAAGADYGLVLAPNYFAQAGADQAGLVAWFTAVAEAAPVPVLFYHYPGVSNNLKVATATVRTLAQHGNVVGAKFSHGDVSAHAQVALDPRIDHESFRLFTGLGQQLLPVMSVGAAGAIDGLANFFPRSVVKLWELIRAGGSSKEARELQYKVSSAEELVVKWGTVGIKEATARIAGFGVESLTRAPLGRGLPEGEWAAWEEVIGEMQKVETRLENEAGK
ncbi:hypothetical protein EDC01DRAFT_647431 [Geopyxis carbonaria]|nr:hypothetical protein EDC01DRAFT_647431 [Geopyxis carbonaria]